MKREIIVNRDNVFLFSYIFFLIVATFMRIFIDYPMWEIIVVATTCSSWLLAMADSDYADAKNSLAAANEELEFCNPVLKEIESFINNLKQIENSSSITEEMEPIEEKIVFWEKYNAVFSSRKGEAEKAIIMAKHKENKSILVTGLGFIVFLCILTFEAAAQFATIYGDKLTVLAFVIMLATQRRSSDAEEAQRKQKDKLRNNRAEWDNLRKKYQKLDMEGTTDAD